MSAVNVARPAGRNCRSRSGYSSGNEAMMLSSIGTPLPATRRVTAGSGPRPYTCPFTVMVASLAALPRTSTARLGSPPGVTVFRSDPSTPAIG